MQKWEYWEVEVVGCNVSMVNGKYLESARGGFRVYANKLGEQGWKMCGIAGSELSNRFVAYFRRPLAQ